MILQIPSNLMMYRFGASLWLGAVLIVWGSVATVTAFVWNEWSFYVLRFLLGLAEAGLLPGLALYLTFWFPSRYRARAVAGYIIAGSFAAILGGPISTALMTYSDHAFGLQGWQWMFVCEGIPAVLLGFFTLYYLADSPARATWLTSQQRAWIESELRTEQAEIERARKYTVLDSIKDFTSMDACDSIWLCARGHLWTTDMVAANYK